MDPLKESARRAPHSVALVAERWSWSYAQLDEAADVMARRLVAAGARSGAHVATLLPGRAEAIQTIHAVPRSGATLVPLNPKWTEAEIGAAMDVLRPVVLVCDERTEVQAAAVFGDAYLLTVDWGGMTGVLSLPEVRPDPDPLPPREASDVYAVLWTSGSAGRPRGVEITFGNLRASARAVAERLDLTAADRWYASLMLTHVGGLALVHRAAFMGSSVAVEEGFDPDLFNQRVDAGEVTHASLVPTMLARVIEHRAGRAAPESLRCILVGGAPVPEALLEEALGLGLPVALTYGLTEACSQVATAPPDLVRRKPGTVGPPLPGVEIRIADDGEVLVRGPTVARGYFGQGERPVDEGGWLRTGDLGRLDDEGHLWLVGRSSERIITGGVNVDPAEVEGALRSHPAVADAVVVGVPDAAWGESVAAIVVRRPGATAGEEEIGAALRELISSPKRPRLFRFVEALPTNANGKVDRAAARRLIPDPGTGG